MATNIPRIGTAGWTIPKRHAHLFPSVGSHLSRYAQRLNAVEINSSFYRPHRRTTYMRWAASVPANFAFSVKAPKTITHRLRLVDAGKALDAFLDQVTGLDTKLGVILFQLPPSLAFQGETARRFLRALRKRHRGAVAIEPRHVTWFAHQVEALLVEYAITRVAADPALTPEAGEPGGWRDAAYFRLHGSPRMYYSAYSARQIESYANGIHRARAADVWCIFDNTAAAAATGNALSLATAIANA